jgi:hypothetical protein
MNYAEAIEEDGSFERARRAWMKSAEEWRQFGNIFIEHSTGVKLQLGSQPRLEKEVADLRAKLEALLPGVRAKLVEEKRAALTEEERQVLDLPKDKLAPEQVEKRYHAEPKLAVTDREIAERIAREEPAKKNQALQLASEIERQDKVLQFTINYKRDANYDYWKTRADFEQTPNALTARARMFEARKAFRDADLPKAKQLYLDGFAKWRAVIDEFPSILDEEQTTGGDLVDFIKRYRQVLDQLDEKLTDDFPLWDVLEKFDRENEFNAELKEYRERHGKATPADKAKADPAPAAAAPATGTPAAPDAAAKPAAAEPATSTDAKPSEKSALAPAPAPPADKNAPPKSDSGKK